MNGTGFVFGWIKIIESVALVAIVLLALGVMVRLIELRYVLRHLGAIFALAIFFILLPVIISALWASMTVCQHAGTLLLAAIIALLAFGRMTR